MVSYRKSAKFLRLTKPEVRSMLPGGNAETFFQLVKIVTRVFYPYTEVNSVGIWVIL